MLGDVPGSPGRLRFEHALIRDVLFDELTTAGRLRLHRQAGEALEAFYAGDVESHLAELAHHFCAAAPAGGAGRGADYARRAAARAAAQLAHEEAVRLYRMALALVEDETARCEVLLALGEAQARSGDTPGSKDSFRAAAELAERLQLSEQVAQAALGYGGRIIWEVSRDDDYLVPLLERAIESIGTQDSALRARLLARLAGGPLRDTPAPPESRHLLGREALEMARRLDDPATLAYALSGYIAAHHSPEHTEEQARLATEQIQMATRGSDLERAAEGYEHRVTALFELGSVPRVKADLASMATLANDLRQPSQEWFVAVYRTLVALFEGKLADAETEMERARTLGERAQSWNAAVSWRLQHYLLRREQGRLAEVEGLVRRSVVEYPTYPIWRCVLTQLAAELGYADEAQELLEAIVAGGEVDLPFDEEWLVSLGLLAEAACSLGDRKRAALLYERLLPYVDRFTVSYPEISVGAVARHLGLLAATMRRWEDAERHFEHAIELHQRADARSWLAHTRRDYARMLSARDAPGDAERAAELRSRAVEEYRALGIEHRASEAGQPR